MDICSSLATSKMNLVSFFAFLLSMQASKNFIYGELGDLFFFSMKEAKIVLSVNLQPKEPTFVMPKSDKNSSTLNRSLNV